MVSSDELRVRVNVSELGGRLHTCAQSMSILLLWLRIPIREQLSLNP